MLAKHQLDRRRRLKRQRSPPRAVMPPVVAPLPSDHATNTAKPRRRRVRLLCAAAGVALLLAAGAYFLAPLGIDTSGGFDNNALMELRFQQAGYDVHAGHELYGNGDFKAAELSYRRALVGAPSGHAMCALGSALREQGLEAAARTEFERAAAFAPHEAGGWYHLGTVKQAATDLPGAAALYRRALQQEPEHLWALANLGTVLAEDCRHTEAISVFSRALHQAEGAQAGLFGRTELASLHYQLGRSFNRIADDRCGVGGTGSCRRYAEEQFSAALSARPDHVLAAWEQAALVGDPDGLVEQEGADVEYVRSLFGAVAETYDASAARRRYAAPARVAAAVAALVGPTRRLGDVLDLGCGTGLSGAALRAVPGLFGGRLVGVEAVPEMLEAAQAKTTLYDATVSGEAAEELAEVLASGRLYDLVAAVDVLPYVRDVAPVLEGAAAVLGRRGLLAVTVDLPQQEDGGGASEGDADFDLEWTLLRDGRFAHGPSMVLRIAVRAGLAPVAKERVVLRHERGRPVVGLVLVFQKLVAEDDGSDGAAGGVDWTTRAPVPAAPAGGGGLVIE